MRSPTRTGVLLFSTTLLAVSSGLVLADNPQPEDCEWNISSLIKGNTGQVRDIINGPLEEQLARKAEKQGQYKAIKDKVDLRQASIAADLRKSSPEFANAETDFVAANKDVSAAHDRGDGGAAITAKNRADADQALIKQRLDAASANDAELVKNKKEMDDAAAEVQRLGPVVANAGKARDQLVNGLRFTVQLPGPADAGGSGVLGKIKPNKIVDAHSFTADYSLFINMGEDKKAKAADGVTVLKGRSEPVKILVTGFDDTTALKEHVEVTIDQFYKLSGQKNVDKQTYWVVERVKPDPKQHLMENLLKSLDTLKVPPGVTYKPS